MTNQHDHDTDNEGIYKLYILRHGIAFPRDGNEVLSDESRKLTPEGKSKLVKTAKGLQRLGVEFDWIVTSPLVRALETAQAISETMKSEAPLDVCTALRPGASIEKLLAFLRKKKERKNILLVGHEPDLSLLAAQWIGAGMDANLTLKKGGCCLIESERLPDHGPGRLIWWLPPRVLRALA